jgi:hypothetical protein
VGQPSKLKQLQLEHGMVIDPRALAGGTDRIQIKSFLMNGLCLKSRFHSHRASARCQKLPSPENRFNGFAPLQLAMETVKTVSKQCQCHSTGLKPGVNDTDF